MEGMVQSEKAVKDSGVIDTRTQAAGTQILVIEDDPHMQKVLQRIFREQGYAVIECGDGQAGLDAFRSGTPSAVILDLLLPNIFGRDLCKIMKAERPGVPVIVVSAISEVADKVLLLELGADDYVTKPFSPRELMARVQAAIRRAQKPNGAPVSQIAFGTITADFSAMEFSKDGAPVILTANEIKLFRYFIDHADRVITREELLNDVWGYTSYPTTRTVDNQVMKLRQKLEADPAKPVHFRTMHGIGYKFVGGS
jgi:DNA-binding response OmpR family regulator